MSSCGPRSKQAPGESEYTQTPSVSLCSPADLAPSHCPLPRGTRLGAPFSARAIKSASEEEKGIIQVNSVMSSVPLRNYPSVLLAHSFLLSPKGRGRSPRRYLRVWRCPETQQSAALDIAATTAGNASGVSWTTGMGSSMRGRGTRVPGALENCSKNVQMSK